jgi:hypothetical protein
MKERLNQVLGGLKKDSENSELKKEEERINRALLYGLESLQNGKIEWWNE